MVERLLINFLLLVFCFTAGPVLARNVKPKIIGDVCNYEFGTANLTDTGIELCWAPACDVGINEAEKFSVEIFGTLNYSFGTADPVYGKEVSFDFGTAASRIKIPLADVTKELKNYFWDEYGLLPSDLNSYSFNMSAKVKGLDPSRKIGLRRQNNCFSEPVDLGILERGLEPTIY